MLESEKDLIDVHTIKSVITKLYIFNYNRITYVFEGEMNKLIMVDAQNNISELSISPQMPSLYFDYATLGKNGIVYFINARIGSIIKYDLNTNDAIQHDSQVREICRNRFFGWFPYDGKIYDIADRVLMIMCPESGTVSFKSIENFPNAYPMSAMICGDTDGRVYVTISFSGEYMRTFLYVYVYDTRTDVLKYVSSTDKYADESIYTNSHFEDGNIRMYRDPKVKMYINYNIKRDEWSRHDLSEETYVIYNVVDTGYYSYGARHENQLNETLVKFVSPPKSKLFRKIPTAYTDMIIDTIEQ